MKDEKQKRIAVLKRQILLCELRDRAKHAIPRFGEKQVFWQLADMFDVGKITENELMWVAKQAGLLHRT